MLMTASARSGGPGDVEQAVAHLQRPAVGEQRDAARVKHLRNAEPAAAPNIRSGSSSGVTSESVAFLTPRSRRSMAAIIANS